MGRCGWVVIQLSHGARASILSWASKDTLLHGYLLRLKAGVWVSHTSADSLSQQLGQVRPMKQAGTAPGKCVVRAVCLP